MTRRAWLALAGGLLAPHPTPAQAPADGPYEALFDGESLAGWTAIGGEPGTWRVEAGTLAAPRPGKSWLSTNRAFADFDLRLSYRLDQGGNSGVLLRAPHRGDPSFAGLEIQLLDDAAPGYRHLKPEQYAGSVYGVIAARRGSARPAGEWNRLGVKLLGPAITVTLNGAQVVASRLDEHARARERHPGLSRTRGFIGLQAHETPVWFRDLAVREVR